MGTGEPDTVEPEGVAQTPRFAPRRLATRSQRTLLLLIGPLLWVGALITVSFVVHHGSAVELGLLVLAGSLLLALVLLIPMRIRRGRHEKAG